MPEREEAEGNSLKKKETLRLIFIRLTFVTSLVISAVIIQFSTAVFLPLNPFYYLILIFYLLSLAYIILYFWGKYYNVQAFFQIFFDLLLITALVYISGGLRGSFYFLYIFEIIAASMVISKRVAYLIAALSAILFGVLVDLMYFGIIPYFNPEEAMEISLGLVQNNIFIAASAFFLVAFLINSLTGMLEKTRNELRRAQKELEIKNRLAIAGEVSGQLAHEIRNPLAAISGSVQVLKEELGLRGEQRELMDIVISESKRISQSIEQFLNLASPVQKTFSPINLSTILKETLTLLQRSGEIDGNIRVEGNYHSADILYFGNGNQFKQLFWNLVKNALKAMPGGGVLTIDFARKKDMVELRFVDTGIGMSEEEKERMSEPFYSGFEDGKGIGMAVVRRIIDDYRGKIDVISAPGEGTEAVITLSDRGRLRNKKRDKRKRD